MSFTQASGELYDEAVFHRALIDIEAGVPAAAASIELCALARGLLRKLEPLCRRTSSTPLLLGRR